ncbi:YbaY family lipoprotein [Moritella sp.]|uniref:YbaY family lipoprotein n=1 Tax=Moritella sp. TaxID=78556 RepID=UPI001D2168B6|nr:YbaY family lipoprotein [Moritella sp.]MCJ8348937.1 YbaY family lipoprotein [Moritella sp.]NQZ38810.1 YbaY family lipoprotein [Moritella sp.]
MQKNKRLLNHKTFLTTAVITSLLMGLSGCVTTEQKSANLAQTVTVQQQSITASVFYRQRIALPPGAQVSLVLEDVSKMDVAAEVIAKQTITAVGAPPYQIDLSYDAAKIKPRHRYALRARIELDGQLLFTNTQQVDAFANQGLKPSEILVSQVRSEVQNDGQASLVDTQWQLSILGSQAITVEETQQPPHLTFTQGDNKVVGFAGCNRFSGRYDVLASNVNLTKLLTTKKLCFQQMNLETQFLTALSETDNYKVIDNTLTLYSNVGIVLGQFTAQANK